MLSFAGKCKREIGRSRLQHPPPSCEVVGMETGYTSVNVQKAPEENKDPNQEGYDYDTFTGM